MELGPGQINKSILFKLLRGISAVGEDHGDYIHIVFCIRWAFRYTYLSRYSLKADHFACLPFSLNL